MNKIEYKDVPIYFAHEDGDVVPTATGAAIASSAASVTANYQSADNAVKEWVSANFQKKS